MKAHYLLFYEKAPDYLERQQPLAAQHLAHLQAAVDRGELVLGGNLDGGDPEALVLFHVTSPSVVEAFAEADPYVQCGAVAHWQVRHWDTVVGPTAAHPRTK